MRMDDFYNEMIMNEFYNVAEMRMNDFYPKMKISNANYCDINFETPTNLLVAGIINGDIVEMKIVLVEWCRWSNSTPIFVHYCVFDNIKYHLWYDVCRYLNIDVNLLKKNRWVKYEYMYNYIVSMNIKTKENLKIIRLFREENTSKRPLCGKSFDTSNSDFESNDEFESV